MNCYNYFVDAISFFNLMYYNYMSYSTKNQTLYQSTSNPEYWR